MILNTFPDLFSVIYRAAREPARVFILQTFHPPCVHTWIFVQKCLLDHRTMCSYLNFCTKMFTRPSHHVFIWIFVPKFMPHRANFAGLFSTTSNFAGLFSTTSENVTPQKCTVPSKLLSQM